MQGTRPEVPLIDLNIRSTRRLTILTQLISFRCGCQMIHTSRHATIMLKVDCHILHDADLPLRRIAGGPLNDPWDGAIPK